MTYLTDTVTASDKRWYIGKCTNECLPKKRNTMCVSPRRLKKILSAFVETDKPYVYLHIDECSGKTGFVRVLRLSMREEPDCDSIVLAAFVVAEEDKMTVEDNNELIEEVASDLKLKTYDPPR